MKTKIDTTSEQINSHLEESLTEYIKIFASNHAADFRARNHLAKSTKFVKFRRNEIVKNL